MVAHLLNIDDGLARNVADGLRLDDMPPPAEAAVPTRHDLPESPALSIIRNEPRTLAGRKVGVLVTDGADVSVLEGLRAELEKEGAALEIVAPCIGGVDGSDGTRIAADHQIDGGPSVLFDAIALVTSDAGGEALSGKPQARDFVADAFAHLKFIGFVDAATPLLKKAGVFDGRDGAFMPLGSQEEIAAYVAACRDLRHWEREPRIVAM